MQIEETNQGQTPTLNELPGKDDPTVPLEKEEDPGPSGLAQQTASACPAGSNATSPTSATNTADPYHNRYTINHVQQHQHSNTVHSGVDGH